MTTLWALLWFYCVDDLISSHTDSLLNDIPRQGKNPKRDPAPPRRFRRGGASPRLSPCDVHPAATLADGRTKLLWTPCSPLTGLRPAGGSRSRYDVAGPLPFPSSGTAVAFPLVRRLTSPLVGETPFYPFPLIFLLSSSFQRFHRQVCRFL